MKILGIINVNIIIDIENSLVTFWNTYMKLYYFYIEDTDISFPETTKVLAKNLANKPANKEILMSFDYWNLKNFVNKSSYRKAILEITL